MVFTLKHNGGTVRRWERKIVHGCGDSPVVVAVCGVRKTGAVA